MTINDEAKQIRAEITKLRPDKRRRYSAELKDRILGWVARATAAGVPEHECGKALGIKTWRIRTWQQEAAAPPSTDALALVAVEVESFAPASKPTVVTPSGYRIEGLIAQVAALLREVA